MQAPPPFPFWPLSPTGPRSLAGVEFDDKELANLETLKSALSARGVDYTTIRGSEPTTLLLDLCNAGKHRLLRDVVNDWGVMYSLWKTSDAYMESSGAQRRQIRELLKYLFFWAGQYPGHGWWPLKLVAHLGLFHREGEKKNVRLRLVQVEETVLRLASSLTNMTRELQICAKWSRFPLRDPVSILIGQSEAALQQAAYFNGRPRPSQREDSDTEMQREDAERAEKLIVRLVHLVERALEHLRSAIYHLGPLDAHRARHVMRQGAQVLLDLLPDLEPKPHKTPAAIMLFDAFLYTSRLVVGFGLIPLVLLTRGLRPKNAYESQPSEKLAG
jgi:hypothetical protein